MTFKVFIGWDSREQDAAEVCRYSILKHTSEPVEIHFLKLKELQAQDGLYTRESDPDSSTEFTFSRFLVPYLCNYTGTALFVDCDFLFTHDIAELFDLATDEHAVHVVQHNYVPPNTIKMDGQTQHQYPRKNWSSLMLFNCAHPDCAVLTRDIVNTQTGQYLHRFEWTDKIGNLNRTWNWLVNWYHEPVDGKPKAIHYTEGGPWFPAHEHTEYGANWVNMYNEYKDVDPAPVIDCVPPDLQKIFDNLLNYRVDPAGTVYGITLPILTQQLAALPVNNIVSINSDVNYEKKGHMYDPILQSFVQGAGGQISNWAKEEFNTTPVVLRGITKRKHMEACKTAGRDFYYMDTGYFGNNIKRKIYHRITRNDMQWFGPVINRPADRFIQTGVSIKKMRRGTNILIAPPSQKLLNNYDIVLEDWLANVQAEIRAHTDRPVVIRTKQGRTARLVDDTMEMALDRDVYCLVTFSSIAAGEALLLGKPAITLGPNAAGPLCSHSISAIENLRIPSLDEVAAWAHHLSYCQFTELEMRDGTAWRILNDR